MLDPFAEHSKTSMGEHLSDFIDHLRTRGVDAKQVRQAKSRLGKALADMGVRVPPDMSTEKAERFLLRLVEDEVLSAKTRNDYLGLLAQFADWGVNRERWPSNPFKCIKKLNAEVDVTRERRALTIDELRQLVEAAKVRSMENYKARCPKASPATLDRKLRQGLERSMVYKAAAMTGLRLKELRTLRWVDVGIDTDQPTLTVQAKYAKSKREDTVELSTEMAESLREWREFRRQELGRPVSGGERIFFVCQHMFEHFPKDALAAGLARADEQGEIITEDDTGRVIDFHSLRHTFSTLLSSAGVTPQVAQKLMRHADITTTMKTYTHIEVLDRRAAVEALPSMVEDSGIEEMKVAVGAENLRGARATNMQPISPPGGSVGGTSGQSRGEQEKPQNLDSAAFSKGVGAFCQSESQTDRKSPECGRRDSNPHSVTYMSLKHARLPVPPLPRGP